MRRGSSTYERAGISSNCCSRTLKVGDKTPEKYVCSCLDIRIYSIGFFQSRSRSTGLADSWPPNIVAADVSHTEGHDRLGQSAVRILSRSCTPLVSCFIKARRFWGQERIGFLTSPLPPKPARRISQEALGSQELDGDAFGDSAVDSQRTSSGPLPGLHTRRAVPLHTLRL